MADWGTANGKEISASITRTTPGSFTPAPDASFNLNITLGTISGRSIGGTGGGTIEYVDRPVFTPTPPSAEAPGDWPMRFWAAEMSPSTTLSGIENIPDLYVCGASSKLYVRYWEIANYSGAAVDASLLMADYPIHIGTVEDGRRVISPEGFNFVMGPGEVIEGKISTDVEGVWLFVSGVETVT